MVHSFVEVPLPLKIKIFVWQLPRDRLPSRTEVIKQNGPNDGLCPLCGAQETRTNIFFACIAAYFLWCFSRDALGPEWEALDVVEFLDTRVNQVGRRICLLLFVFAAMTWTFWTTRNMVVIERVFLWRATDSIFQVLAFLQH